MTPAGKVSGMCQSENKSKFYSDREKKEVRMQDLGKRIRSLPGFACCYLLLPWLQVSQGIAIKKAKMDHMVSQFPVFELCGTKFCLCFQVGRGSFS